MILVLTAQINTGNSSKDDNIIPWNTTDDSSVTPSTTTEDVIPHNVAYASSMSPLNPCTVTIKGLLSAPKM